MTFAYIDEADAEPTPRRPGLYLIAAVLIEHTEADKCDLLLRSLLRDEDADPKGHRRLHFSRIKDRQRKADLVSVLGCLRGTRFVIAWVTGYADTKAREHARGQIMWDLLPYLVNKENAIRILIEEREDATLRARDARTIGRLRNLGIISLDLPIEQTPASTAPGLWLADVAAAAWRRHLVEGKENWSRWYASHTTLLEVTYRP